MMRKLLSSSNATMVAVLVVLVAIGAWAILASVDEPATPTAEQASAVGGGPIEPADRRTQKQNKPAAEPVEAPANLDKPDLAPEEAIEPSNLDRPEAADGAEGVQSEDEPASASSGSESQSSPESDDTTGDVDQEEAFRDDDAPEAEVIATEPPESHAPSAGEQSATDERQARQGGGPIDEPNVDDEELDRAADEAAARIDAENADNAENTASEDESATSERTGGAEETAGGESGTQPQRVEDLMNDLERDEGGVKGLRDQFQSPPPSDQPSADESIIDRPSLREAPRPSRAGEKQEAK